MDSHQDSRSGGDSFQDEESKCGVQFSPPLYIQRYMLVVEFLTKHSVQSVVDFGCSECGFFPLLSTVPSLQSISLVDIDRELLISRSRVISPRVTDYIHRRSLPLHVSLYAGSAGDHDARMTDCVAISLIEVIEHLEPALLKSVVENIFGHIRPKHVAVTTPNSEFNVLFGNSNNSFRHWDHKFEWTRDEFRSWCETVCEAYGYTVDYTGVGFLPSKPESSHLGPCSQAAFFLRLEEVEEGSRLPELKTAEVTTVEYELIGESEFPYDDSRMTLEERLDLEVMYTIRQIARLKAVHCDDWDGETVCVSVGQIANRKSVMDLASPQQVREHLHQKRYKLTDGGDTVVFNLADLQDDKEDSCDDGDGWDGDDDDGCGDDDDGCGDGDLQQEAGVPKETCLDNWDDD